MLRYKSKIEEILGKNRLRLVPKILGGNLNFNETISKLTEIIGH